MLHPLCWIVEFSASHALAAGGHTNNLSSYWRDPPIFSCVADAQLKCPRSCKKSYIKHRPPAIAILGPNTYISTSIHWLSTKTPQHPYQAVYALHMQVYENYGHICQALFSSLLFLVLLDSTEEIWSRSGVSLQSHNPLRFKSHAFYLCRDK